MIPILEEQSTGSRHPFFEVYAAWGGDLALSSGLVGCTATSSSAAAGYPASNANDGDKTVLNSSWWESTNVGGEAFSKTTDGYVFHDDFDDFSNWSAELAAGSPVSNTSTADSPWARFAVASSAAPASAYVFRRSSSTYSFSSERIYQFALDVPSCRSHSDTQYNNISFILCPTSVATAPFSEANWLTVTMEARNEGLYIIVGKNIASVYTEIYTSGELTTNKKQSNFRVIINATTLLVWHEDLGYIVDSVAHGLSFTTPYIYLQLGNKSGDVREGSVGYLSIFKGQTQVVQNLNAATMVSLKVTDLLNTDFSRSGVYATQDYVEDFQKYTLGTEPWEYVVGDNGGSSEFVVNNYSGICSRLYNDEDYWTWCRYTQRKFYDFEMTSEIYFPNFGNYEYLAEDFESYSVSDYITKDIYVDNFFDAAPVLLTAHTGNTIELNKTGNVYADTNDCWTIAVSGEISKGGGKGNTYTSYINIGTRSKLIRYKQYIDSAVTYDSGLLIRTDGTGTDYLLVRLTSNGTGEVELRSDSTQLAVDTTWVISTGWHDVVVLDDNSNIKVYVDGVEYLDYDTTENNSLYGVGFYTSTTCSPKYKAWRVKTDISVWDFYSRSGSGSSPATDDEFTIVAGKYGRPQVSADWGWWKYHDWQYRKSYDLTNYRIEFDRKTSDRMIVVLRASEEEPSTGYYVSYTNGSELAIRKFSSSPDTTTDLYVESGADVQVPDTEAVKVEITGTDKVTIKLWMGTNIYREIIDDAVTVYTEGTFGFLTNGTHCQIDNLVVTVITESVQEFNHLIRVDSALNNGYVLRHDLINDRFQLCKGMAAGVGQSSVLSTTAYDYGLPGQWYKVRCLVLDNRIQVWINGTSVMDYIDSSSPVLSGYIGLQLKPGAMYPEVYGGDYVGYGYIRNIIVHSASLPSYWNYYNDNCGFVIQQTPDYIWYPELMLTRTSADSTDFSWVEISDATSSTDEQFYGENHRGGYLSSDCSSVGTPAGSSSTAIQTATYAYRNANSTTCYIGVYHIADSDGGKYEIWVNTTLVGTVDTYAASKTYEWVNVGAYQFTTGSGNHTITLRKIGEKNASSTDYWVRILEIGVFFTEDEIPTTSVTRAFSEGASKTDVNDPQYSLMMIADQTVISGQECGVKQSVTFPKGRPAYITAVVSTDTANTQVTLIESLTGTSTVTTLAVAHQDYTLSLPRTNIEGGRGEIGLYVSSVPLCISKVYVKSLTVLGGESGEDGLTHLLAPYTASAGTLTGTAPEFSYSNLLLSSESLNSTEWYKYGTLTFDSVEYVNPYDNGELNAEKIQFSNNSYFYQTVEYDYKEKIFTFSVWLKSDDSSSEIYLGVIEDWDNPKGDELTKVIPTSEWQRFSVTVASDVLDSTVKVDNKLYVYIGTDGLDILDDITSTPEIYIWGSQLAESTNLCRYYPRGNADLLGSTEFDQYPWISSYSQPSTLDLSMGFATSRLSGCEAPYIMSLNETTEGYWSFNGTNNYVVLGSASELDYTSEDFTIYCEMNIDNLTGFKGIVWKGNDNVEGYYWTINGAGMFFVTNQAGSLQVSRWYSCLSTGWATYAIVRNGTSVDLYINGVIQTKNVAGVHSNPLTSAQVLRIGRLGAGYHYKGYMRNVRFFSEVLTVDQLLALTGGENVKGSNLDLWYKCLGSAGNTIDFSGNDHTGAPTGTLTNFYNQSTSEDTFVYDIRPGTTYLKSSSTGDWKDVDQSFLQVIMWYNQFDQRYHAYQEVNDNRPILDLNKNNGQPHLVFSDSHYLKVDFDLDPSVHPEVAVAFLFESDDVSSDRKIYGHDDGGFDRCVGFDTGVVDYGYYDGTTVTLYDNLSTGTLYTDVHNWTAATFDGWIDGTSKVVAGACANGSGDTSFYIGAEGSGLAQMFEGKISSFFLRDSVFTTTERQSIERFFDALYKGNVQIKDVTSLSSFTFDSLVWLEDFSSYSVGTDLTGEGWTEHNYDATTRSFTVENGDVAVGAVDPNTSYCSYRWNNVAAQEWENYEFRFTLTKDLTDSEVLGINFRYTTSGGYSIIYDPASSELRLYRCSDPNMVTGRTLAANWDASIPSSMSEVRVVVKDSTVDFIVDDILIGTYTGLVYTKGSVGYTFGKTDVTYTESISLTGIEIRTYTLANKIDLTSAGIDTNSAYYDSGVALTGRTFEASIWLRTFTGEGDVYIVIEDSSATNYVIRKVTLTKDWQKVVLPMIFPYTVDTDLYVKILTAAYDTYSALSDISIEAWGASLYEETHDSDHSHIWEGTVNLILRSEEFDHASWSKHATTTVTADQYVNPLFNMESADKIVNVTAGHGVYQSQVVVAPASNTFTFSVWVRADEDTDFYLEINDDPGGQAFQEEFTAKPYWQRFEFTATFVASVQAGTICELRAKDASSTIYAWGAQFEQKSNYATKYEQTVAATTTRNDTRLRYTMPTAVTTYDQDWSVLMRVSLLADAYDSIEKHTLVTLGSYSATVDDTARLYLENGYLKLDIQDDNSETYSQIVVLPVEDMDLYGEYVFGIIRTDGQWSFFLRTQSNEYSGTITDTGFILPQYYYVGVLDDNSDHGNVKVSDVTLYDRSLTSSEVLAYVTSSYNTQYDLTNIIQAIIPYRGSTSSYISGGSVTFTLGIDTEYPLSVEWGLWEKTDQLLLQSEYDIYGGTVWEYAPDWLLLTFDSAITFNRVNLYAYPNQTSSLQTPYEVGKGGLKAWSLDYWDSTSNTYKPFYRKIGSTTDLDIVDLTQLCTNGIFEEGLTDWISTTDFVTLSQDSTEFLTGLHSMKVEIYSAPTLGQGARYASTFLPGNSYTATTWAKGAGTIRAEVYDGNSWHYGTSVILNSSEWQKITVSFSVDSSATWGGSFVQFVTSVSTVAVFNLDEVTIVPSVTTSVTTTKIRLVVQNLQNEGDVTRVTALQVYNFIDESSYVKENNVTLTYRKTSETNFISPGQFQVVLSNLDGRYSPKNSNSPIYGVTQLDGRGWVRAGTPIELWGGYETTDGDTFKSPLMKGTIGSEQDPAANTGVEVDTSDECVTLVGGDSLSHLERTIIEDYNILDSESYEGLLTYLCQIAGFAIQDMQFDESGVSVEYSWFGGGISVLDIINKIVEASDGAFFVHPSQLKRALFYYDGVKFKSWLQTTKDDFDAGIGTNTTTSISPGNVLLVQGSQSNNMFSWGSVSDVYYGYYWGKLSLYDQSTYTYDTFNVKDYHMESAIAHNWDYVLAPTSSIFRYTNGAVGLDYYNRCKAQSYDGGSTSIIGFNNLDLGTDPEMVVELVDETGTVITSTGHRLYNSGEGYEIATDLENGVIPNPSTASATASYTIRFTTTTTVNLGEYLYVYFPAQTGVANGSWGNEHAGTGLAIAGVTLDGNAIFRWFATAAAYKKISMRTAIPGSGLTIYPGNHELIIDSAVVNTITNPAFNGTSYKLYVGTSHENYLWSENYRIGYDNGVGPGTYYFSRHRAYNTGSYLGDGALTGRSDAFVVPAGKRRIPKVYHWGGGSSDKNWTQDTLYWQVNPADPDDAIYYSYVPASPNWTFVVHGSPVSAWDNKYFASGRKVGTSDIPSGWNVIEFYDWATASTLNYTGGKVKLRMKFKGQSSEYSILQTKEYFDFHRYVARFYFRVMQFEGTVLIDSVQYGAARNPLSGYATTNSFDTSDVAPNWGDVSISMLRALTLSKSERVRIYSQTSDDDITWYGLAGAGTWDLLLDHQTSALTRTARIVSPSKRYIRFKVQLDSTDTYFTPVVSAMSFKYTNDGNIVSQYVDVTSTVNKWGIFQSNYTLGDYGTITFETLSADDAGFASPDPAGWQTATPGSLIASAVKRYLKWRATLETSYGEYTPSLHDVTINWEKGLTVPSEIRSYSYDNRLKTFVPKSGNPSCNKATALANFYLVDQNISTNDITAYWNGGVPAMKTCGEEVASYPSLPLSVDPTTKTIVFECSDPTITPNTSVYSTYPRAFVVTVGLTNYGVYGYVAGSREGTQFSFLAGALKLTFSGTAKRITVVIETTGATSIADMKVYGYPIKKAGDLVPPLLLATTNEDADSQALYNQVFLKEINNEYITSENAADTLTSLLIDEGKFVKDYGQITIPIAFSLNLQTKFVVTQPNAGWDNQVAEAYEIQHRGSDWTTSVTLKEK
jgi:hypothetical protein